MKQAKLKLKTYAGRVGVVNNGTLQSKMLRVVLGLFAVSALFYVFILGNMILNIIERKSLEAEARILLSDVGNLELDYLSLSSKIGPELGRSLGFVETSAEHFVTRKELGSISFLNNEL